MIASIFRDLIATIYPELIFAALFSYFSMYFYLISTVHVQTGGGVKFAHREWLKQFRESKLFRRTYFFVVYIYMIIFKTLIIRDISPNSLHGVFEGWWMRRWSNYKNAIEYNVDGIENIIMFVPFAILGMGVLVIKFKYDNRNELFRDAIKYSFLFSFMLESIQLIFHLGTFQLADLFYNTLGGILGGMIYYSLIRKSFINKSESIEL